MASLNINLDPGQYSFTVNYIPEAISMYIANSVTHTFISSSMGSNQVQITPQKTYVTKGT